MEDVEKLTKAQKAERLAKEQEAERYRLHRERYPIPHVAAGIDLDAIRSKDDPPLSNDAAPERTPPKRRPK